MDGTSMVKVEKAACAHFWVVEPPSKPESLGVCSLCGDEKLFPNHDDQTGKKMSWSYGPKKEKEKV
jgi:hypothetical protein